MKKILFIITFLATVILDHILLAGISITWWNSTIPDPVGSGSAGNAFFFLVYLGVPAMVAYFVAFSKSQPAKEIQESIEEKLVLDNSKKDSTKRNIIFALLVMVGFVVLMELLFQTVWGLYVEPYTYTNVVPGELKNLKSVDYNAPTPTPLPTLKPVEKTKITDETREWKTYKLPTLKIELKLPPQVSSRGDWQERVIPGEKGTQLDFYPEETKVIGDFRVGTTSIDYQQGRGGTFLDLQGYEINEGKYYAKFVGQKKIFISDKLVKEIKNPYGVNILKVYGVNYNEENEASGLPLSGTPGEGNIGALINTGDSTYPGLAIFMKLQGEQTEELFDKILSTVKR